MTIYVPPSTSTPASEVSAASFRDDIGNSAELEARSLDDILRNSPAAKLLGLKDKESLPEDDDSVPTPEESASDESDENAEDADNDPSEDDNQEVTTEDEATKDDASTQSELPSEEDIDWEYKVPVTVDGKTEYVSLEEIRKGYSTDKHLSQKGRELGELKKQVEQERSEKLQELVQLGTVLVSELTEAETALQSEYHKISADIEKAKSDGDSYTARELKEKREEVQEQYWQVRNQREAKAKAVTEQWQAQQQENQKKLLDQFNVDIVEAIPGFDTKTAVAVREFAIKEGIPESLLDVVYDAKVVKFINDYRKLKTAKDKGEMKRKEAPVTKSVPTKSGRTVSQREQQSIQNSRTKVLSGQGDSQDQLDFLKRISSISRKL